MNTETLFTLGFIAVLTMAMLSFYYSSYLMAKKNSEKGNNNIPLIICVIILTLIIGYYVFNFTDIAQRTETRDKVLVPEPIVERSIDVPEIVVKTHREKMDETMEENQAIFERYVEEHNSNE